MAKKFYALKSTLFGPTAEDGSMGLVLTELFGATAKGTATLTSTTPETAEIEIEETDDLYDEIETKGAVWSLAGSTYNVSKETMKEFFGGTITGNKWAPAVDGNTTTVYRSALAETRSGIKVGLVKVKITATANLAFDKTKLGQIDWTAKVLKPDKAGIPSMDWDFGA
jgi:hypothetical protein